MKDLRNNMFTIYRDDEVDAICNTAMSLVNHYTPEVRNRTETIPKVFKRMLYGGYFEITNRGHIQYSHHVNEKCVAGIPSTIDTIKKGDYIYRFNGRQLGCISHSDYRQCLNIVVVDRVCEKTIRGQKGEIVRPEQIIIVTREDVK